MLDVGCAKGFLVKDLMKVCPGLEAFGLDISDYALMNCEPEVVGRLHLGNCDELPFPDGSFDAVDLASTPSTTSSAPDCIRGGARDRARWRPGAATCRSIPIGRREQKAIFEDWVLTAKTPLRSRRLDRSCSRRPATPATTTGPSSNEHAQHDIPMHAMRANVFDAAAARERCQRYRRRILDISQQVSALHIGSRLLLHRDRRLHLQRADAPRRRTARRPTPS